MEGTQDNPVRNVKFAGLLLTGTERTELAPHGVPSGGDWVGMELGPQLYGENLVHP